MKTELRTISPFLGFLVLVSALNPHCADASTNRFIPRNSAWKYHNLNQDLGTAWLDLNYDDSNWTNAVAPLGDNAEAGVQQITEFAGTVIAIVPMVTRYPTI